MKRIGPVLVVVLSLLAPSPEARAQSAEAKPGEVATPQPTQPSAPSDSAASAASQAASPTPQATAASPQKDDGPRTEGIIPGVLFGPKATATLLFPPSVMVGAELRIIGYIGASFEYGVFPRSQDLSNYHLEVAANWSAGLRWYPWRGAFFVGAVLGAYDLSASQPGGASGQPTTTLKVSSMYLGPQIGWKWAWDFGLFLGLNLGYGFSLNYESSLTPTAAGGDLQTAKDNADKYLKPGVPVLTLLELGWLF